MPSPDTLSIGPIASLVWRYLFSSKLSVDVFARNCSKATITNDLNPATSAQYHLEALAFLQMLKSNGTKSDLVLFDPPYSSRQIKECYQSIGRLTTQQDTQQVGRWTLEKKSILDILADNGHVISFGWSSNGMGMRRHFRIVEILIVAHGGAHNDTIVTVEQKITDQLRSLFSSDPSTSESAES